MDEDIMKHQAPFKTSTYLWIFMIFGVLGYLFETIVVLIQHGHIRGTQGLIGLPFSQIYGLGGLILLIIHPFIKSWSNLSLLTLCSVLGGGFEYASSWLQELMFHTISWDYAQLFTNIGGRTTLIYALVWGGLCVVSLRYLLPSLILYLEHRHERWWVPFTTFIVGGLIFMSLISSLACLRYVERAYQKPPHNALDFWLDAYFPDEVVLKTYPNLQIRNPK